MVLCLTRLTAEEGVAFGTWALVAVTLALITWQVVAQKSAQRQTLFVQLSSEFRGATMVVARKRFAEAALKRATECDPGSWDETMLEFFENIGFMVRHNYLDVPMVWSYFSYSIFGSWLASKEYIERSQRKIGDETLFADVKWLYDRILEEEAAQRDLHTPAPEWTDDDVERFLKSETRLIPSHS